MAALMAATERQVFDRLEATIRDGHRTDDQAGLADAYAQGAALYERQGEINAACFFWTQAYIIALDAGADQLAGTMSSKLETHGRMG
ncbi:MAG: hypothetical protein ACRBM6_16095 [Geminicoccales bacterium]